MYDISKNLYKKKIIYIYDALCPWCYAFTPVVKKLYDNYNKEFDFEIITGGLAFDDGVKLFGGSEESLKLKEGYKIIEERTGAEFGEDYFNLIASEKLVMNSEIPARALAAFRGTNSSGASIDFAHKLLKSIFYKGKNLNEDRFYKDLAEEFGLEGDSFLEKMQEDSIKQEARYDFTLAKQLKAEAFPRLYMQSSESYFYLISKGYSDYDTLVRVIKNIQEGA